MKIRETHTLLLSERLRLFYYQLEQPLPCMWLHLAFPIGSAHGPPAQVYTLARYLQSQYPFALQPELQVQWDWTDYRFVGDSSQRAELYSQVARLLKPVAFSQHALLPEIQGQLALEEQNQEHQIVSLVNNLLCQVAFAETPYAWTRTGQKNQRDNLTMGALAHLHMTQYLASPAYLIVTDSLPLYPALQQMGPGLAVPSGAAPPRRPPMAFPKRFPGFQEQVFYQTLEAGWAGIGFRLPGMGSPGWLAAFVLQYLLQESRGLHSLPPALNRMRIELIPGYLQSLLVFRLALPRPDEGAACKAQFFQWLAEMKYFQLDAGLIRKISELALAQWQDARENWRETLSPLHQFALLNWHQPLEKALPAVEINDIRRLLFQYLVMDNATVVELLPFQTVRKANASYQQNLRKLGQHSLPVVFPHKAVAAGPGRLEQPESLTLGNGLSVLLYPSQDEQGVTLGAWLPNGSAQDPGSGGGTTYLMFLMLKACFNDWIRHLSPYRPALLPDSFHFCVERDFSYFCFRVPANQMAQGGELLLRLLSVAAFPRFVFEQGRHKLLSLLQEQAFDPYCLSRDHLFCALFSNHPYAHAPEGVHHEVLQVNEDDILWQYQESFRPERVHVLLTGAFNTRAVKEFAWQRLGQVQPMKERPLSWTPTDREREISPRRGTISLRSSLQEPYHRSGRLLQEPVSPEWIAGLDVLKMAFTRCLPQGSPHNRSGLGGVEISLLQKASVFSLYVAGSSRPESWLAGFLDAWAPDPADARHASFSAWLRQQSDHTLWHDLALWESLGLGHEAYHRHPEQVALVPPEALHSLLTQYFSRLHEWTFVVVT